MWRVKRRGVRGEARQGSGGTTTSDVSAEARKRGGRVVEGEEERGEG